MDRNEYFLDIFQEIEAFFRPDNSEPHQSFPYLIGKSKNAFVRRHRDEFTKLNNLRNTLAHGIENRYMEVNDDGIELVEYLRDGLYKPRRAEQLMKREVITVEEHDPLSKVLRLVHEEGHTQFPVMENGKVLWLMTDTGIVHWLASNIREDIISISETKVSDILEKEEHENKIFKFVPIDASEDELVLMFQNDIHLRTVLVTKFGSGLEPLQGLITRWDMIDSAK